MTTKADTVVLCRDQREKARTRAQDSLRTGEDCERRREERKEKRREEREERKVKVNDRKGKIEPTQKRGQSIEHRALDKASRHYEGHKSMEYYVKEKDTTSFCA